MRKTAFEVTFQVKYSATTPAARELSAARTYRVVVHLVLRQRKLNARNASHLKNNETATPQLKHGMKYDVYQDIDDICFD